LTLAPLLKLIIRGRLWRHAPSKGNAMDPGKFFCRVRSVIADTLCYTLGLSQTDVARVGLCFVSPLHVASPPSPLLLFWMREKWFIYPEEGTYQYILHHSNAPLACTRVLLSVPRTYAACAGRFGRDRCGASHIVPHIDCPAPYMCREGGYVGCRVCLCCSCLQCC